MKLLKTLISAALILCVLLSPAPAALAKDGDPRFDGKTWEEVVEDFNARLGIGERNAAYGYRNTVTGEEHFFNADQYMVSASMYKVPLNMIVAEKVYEGDISFDTLIGGLSYRQLQEGSIIHSDNDFARVLWMYVGSGVYRSYRRVIAPLMGEDADTVDPQFYVNNYFTPRQMIHCLNELYTNAERYPGVIECMKQAEPTEYFRRSENRYEIAHKYGFWEDATLHMNDCAIVYTDEPILIVCFTDGLHNAYQVLAEFCTLMCDYAQYELAHRKPAEGAAERALEGLSLPRLQTQAETPLPQPVPTPEPTEPPVEQSAAQEAAAVPPWIWIAAAAGLGLVFVLCALGRRKLRRKRLLAGLLSLLLAAGAGGIAWMSLSPAALNGADGLLPAMAVPSEEPEPPVPDPGEFVMSFFDALELRDYKKFYAMLDGYASLGLEQAQEDAVGSVFIEALKDSYSYRLVGESRIDGELAEQDVTLRSLDLNAAEQVLREEARRQLDRITEERSYPELCDENGDYKPEVAQEAVNAAVSELSARIADCCAERTLTLHLIYSDGWHVRGEDALVNAVTGVGSD